MVRYEQIFPCAAALGTGVPERLPYSADYITLLPSAFYSTSWQLLTWQS